MAVVLRLRLTVQSGQPILVQSYPTDLFTIFIPRGIKVVAIATLSVSFENYVDNMRWLGIQIMPFTYDHIQGE